MEWRWKNFKPSEVLSPEGLAQYDKGNLLLQPLALDTLQELRNLAKKPLYVNTGELKLRGYRSPKENEKAGGVEYSRHVQGLAFDISWDDDLSSLVTLAKRAGFLYIKRYSTWIHVDIGVRW